MNAESIAARALPLLERLVAFDTTSARSNLALVEWVEGYLAGHGVASARVASDDGAKANLMAGIGPAVGGGVILSGHTDVVPVAGQPWTSDPWTLTRRGERLYGRGTCDMKGFLALALAAVPDLVAAPLRRPAHLAFSYDEEVGCLGAPRLIAALAGRVPAPALVVVGEPTDMRAVGSHKGVIACAVTVTGHEAHSSQTHLGVSAVMEAVGLMAVLRDLAIRLEVAGRHHHDFTPPFSTLTIGVVEGGTAANILARRCRFVFDLRTAPGIDPHALLADFRARVASVDAGLKARFPNAGVALEVLGDVPPLAAEPKGAAETFVRGLIGDNGPARAVPFAAEGGQFQRAGFSTVIVGPGSIDQAHQPDEYVEVAQMERGAAFMARLAESLSAA